MFTRGSYQSCQMRPTQVDLRLRSMCPARGRTADSREETPPAKLAARKPFNNPVPGGPTRVGFAKMPSSLTLSRVAVGQITVRVDTAGAADPGEWRVGNHWTHLAT
jgi:hypothetical protein